MLPSGLTYLTLHNGFEDCEISDNGIASGSGIQVSIAAQLTIRRSTLAGNAAFATLVYLGGDAWQREARVAGLLSGPSGLSRIGERLVIRAMADSGLALRRIITPIIAELSGAGALPRLWHL